MKKHLGRDPLLPLGGDAPQKNSIDLVKISPYMHPYKKFLCTFNFVLASPLSTEY
jgi:hypothetical protein